MSQTIRARYHNGFIEPLEKLNLMDNTEITVTVSKIKKSAKLGDLKPFLGIWAGPPEEYETILQAIKDSKSDAEF